MIAGIAAVLLVAVIGGWYVFAGSSTPEAAVPEPVVVQPQAPVEQQPVTEPETAVTTDPDVTSEPEQTEIQPTIEETSAPTQTAVRSQPAKQPVRTRQNTATSAPATSGPGLPPPPKTQTAKKKLTVDDLLKDN